MRAQLGGRVKGDHVVALEAVILCGGTLDLHNKQAKATLPSVQHIREKTDEADNFNDSRSEDGEESSLYHYPIVVQYL